MPELRPYSQVEYSNRISTVLEVKHWNYWKAELEDATRNRAALASLVQASSGVMKDTTHMVMIDPITQNRLAAADPRRNCYAIAY